MATPSPATTSAPTSALTAEGNDLEGVRVFGDDNRIGGPNPEDRNVLAGSGFADPRGRGDWQTRFQNNHVGTNRTGTIALGDHTGVDLESSGNTVRDNLISGESSGVQISSDDNVVQGNKVPERTQVGNAALPNTVGIEIFGGDRNVIGGPADEEGNVLSGNEHSGVQLSALRGSGHAQRRRGQPDRYPTAAGNAKLPNGGGSGGLGTRAGVAISGSDNNTIGGTTAGAGNVIYC